MRRDWGRDRRRYQQLASGRSPTERAFSRRTHASGAAGEYTESIRGREGESGDEERLGLGGVTSKETSRGWRNERMYCILMLPQDEYRVCSGSFGSVRACACGILCICVVCTLRHDLGPPWPRASHQDKYSTFRLWKCSYDNPLVLP